MSEVEVHPEPPVKGVINILSPNGDDEIIWDSRYADEVMAAERRFNELIGKGYLAFRVVGGQRELIKKFSHRYEKIVMTPPLRGG